MYSILGCKQWLISQKFSVNSCEWIKDTFQFNEHFIKKNYIEESYEGYFFEVDVQYFEKLHDVQDDLPLLLLRRMKTEKVENLVANLHDKTEYIIHIRNWKLELNHGLVLKKFLKLIECFAKTMY